MEVKIGQSLSLGYLRVTSWSLQAKNCNSTHFRRMASVCLLAVAEF